MKIKIICVLLLAFIAFIFVYMFSINESHTIIDKDRPEREEGKELPKYNGDISQLIGIINPFNELHKFYPKKIPLFLAYNDLALKGRSIINSDEIIKNKNVCYEDMSSRLRVKYATILASVVFAKSSNGKLYFKDINGYGKVQEALDEQQILLSDFSIEKYEAEYNARLAKLRKEMQNIEPLIKKEERNEKEIFARQIKEYKERFLNVNDLDNAFTLIYLYSDEYERISESVESLYKSTANSFIKSCALWPIIKFDNKKKLPFLLNQYSIEENEIVKLQLIRGIAEFGGEILPIYIKHIDEQIEKGTWEIKVFAIEALASIGKESFDTIVKCLRDKEPDVRTAAMLALTKIAPDKAVKPLYETYKSEKEIDLKYNAWYCLTKCLDLQRKAISLKEFNDKEKEISESLGKIMAGKEMAENE